MKNSDLYRKWADIIDMCEGKCEPICRWRDSEESNPSFSSNPDEYTFPIAVVENKPVFVGDKVWHPTCSSELKVVQFNSLGLLETETEDESYIHESVDCFSWTNDEYTVFKKALAEGKRVAILDYDNNWVIPSFELKFNLPIQEYKIIENDETEIVLVPNLFGEYGKIIITKSGLTGEITVEVVRNDANI